MRKLFMIAALLCFGAADAQRVIVTDSGGTEREISRICVEDSGGTTRCIQRMFVEDSGGTARLVFSPGTVTVTGAAIGAAGETTVQLLINTDGTIDKNEGGVVTQLSPSTDWIIPNSAASSSYEVRFTNYTGSGPDGSTTLTEDVWAAIDQQHVIRLVRTAGEGNGQDTSTFDLEIRFGSSGAALDSGGFSMCAERGTSFC